jgi:hypothetical protein
METCSRKVIMIKLPENHPYKDGRTCSKCNTFKPADAFAREKDKRAATGVAMRADCKVCMEERKYKAMIKKTYGFTYEEYEKILDDQKGCCAICKSRIGNAAGKRLFVDHCHDTLKVRGLLCSQCNMGLGLFKDSPTLLQKAINYLADNK